MRLKIKIAIFLLISGLATTFSLGYSQAANGEIYISPASSSVEIGNLITIELRINPGTSVNAIQATLDYNQADLQFVSTQTYTFTACTTDSGGGGSVSLACGEPGGSVSTDTLIANITFKSLVGSGSDPLTLTNVNAVDPTTGSYTNPAVGNASISYTSPPPVVASAPKKYYSYTPVVTNNTPAPVVAPAPIPVKVNFTLSTKNIQYTSAEVNIGTNIAVQVYLKYGSNLNNLDSSSAETSLSNINRVNLGSPPLIPGTKYYFQVIAKDTNGNVTQGPTQSFVTKGFSINISVLDQNYQLVKNQIVSLSGGTTISGRTDDKGVVTFNNLAPGLYSLEYSAAKNNLDTQAVYVLNSYQTTKNGQIAAPQKAAVIFASYKQKSDHTISFLTISLLIIVLVEALALIIKSKFLSALNKLTLWLRRNNSK